MIKFGLPDVVIERLTRSDGTQAGNVINLVCQRLADNPQVTRGGIEDFSIEELQLKSMRDRLTEMVIQGGTGKITAALLPARALEGDPDNSILELDFRTSPGTADTEKRKAAFAGLWGAKDSIKEIKHDDEILAASQRAREKLAQLRADFIERRELGSRLLLKAPFKRDDEGNEWMWVEVTEWPETGRISGVLQNDPFYIVSLKAGSLVKISESEVFDYLLYHADGKTEGNETGKVIERRAGPERTKY
jgi:uncharacterized protein YegJ (DUF2314 family)